MTDDVNWGGGRGKSIKNKEKCKVTVILVNVTRPNSPIEIKYVLEENPKPKKMQ